ncbi:hypothetical protein NEUTE2DRAFT_103300 [Neurospora tetrasperma FGSC 2509]|nr:hypothetical protein NEUTE2DRAFT_103300 [Neurospora tetrasperma FGSC 2509]
MGCLPIHHAVRQQRSRLDIVRALDPHLETLWKSDHLKRSILHMAAAAGALDVVEEVLHVASQTEPAGDIAENTHTSCDSCLCVGHQTYMLDHPQADTLLLQSNYGDAWHCTTCTNECPQDEFDLCFKCFPHRAIVHPPSHVFESLTDGWYWSYHQERRVALGLGHDAGSDSDSDFSDSSDSSGSDSN